MFNHFFNRIAMQCTVIAMVLFTFSCEKNSPFSEDGLSPAMSGTGEFSGINVSNGMLVFGSEDDLNDVIEAIQGLESELKDYLDNLHGSSYPTLARYNAIIDEDGPFDGQNPISGADLPTYSGAEIEKIDDDPIKYLFEEAFAYSSLRRYLVDEEYQLLDDGVFDGAGNDPDDHFIPDDYLRLILNDKLELKVGDFTYKIVSSTAILQMENATTEQLTGMRAEFAPPLSYTEVQEQPNPGVCYGNPAVQNYPGTTVIDFMEPQAPQACDADFTYSVGQVLLTQVTFTNASTGNYSSLTWSFGDGNVSTSSSPTHTYSQNGTYNVTLTLYDGVNVCDAETRTVAISSSCVADFAATVSNSNQLLVSFYDDSRSNSSGATVTGWLWDFGDGSGTSTLANPNYTYSSSGTYQVCLYITTSDNCTENHCENVFVTSECCKTNRTTRMDSSGAPIGVGNNRGYKGKVWIVSIPFYRKAGSETTCYRLKNNGNWVKEKADYIYAFVGGNVFSTDCSLSAPFDESNFEYDKKSVDAREPFGYQVRTQLNQIAGAFEFDDNGSDNWVDYGWLLANKHCD